jgi:hypothetical protein
MPSHVASEINICLIHAANLKEIENIRENFLNLAFIAMPYMTERGKETMGF